MIRNHNTDWTGRWISAPWATVNLEPKFTLAEMFSGGKLPAQTPVSKRLKPAVIFTREFSVTSSTQATLTITAQGIYQAYLNDQPVTDACFAPDYTAYDKQLMYQDYDVSQLLVPGSNTLRVVVADGWYAGRISVQGNSAQFGNQLALLADLTLTAEDQTQTVIGTDDQFTVGTGKWRYADIQIGEMQDLRLSDQTISSEPATIIEADYTRLRPQVGPQVRKQAVLAAKKIWREDMAWIVDFGQVLVGRVRLSTTLATDQKVILEHAEVLDQAGRFFQNIVGRNKDQTDVFIGRGRKDSLCPDFTFHGFRYVKITGLAKLSTDQITAEVLHSDLQVTGKITTNDTRINRLLENIRWSQIGNMLSIPTDCPQRERAGWTGDMQVFAPASTFYYNTQTFIRRWLQSVRSNQEDNGEILDYSPAPKDFYKNIEFTGSPSSAGWGDAIIMVPWTLYQRYGDSSVLSENYQAMRQWHTYAMKSAAGDKTDNRRYLWDTKFHYGDWMLPSIMAATGDNPMATAEATKDLVATAFLAHTSDLLAQIATVLGEDPKPYKADEEHIKDAFTQYYLTADNHLTSDYQGCYVLALAFDLIPTVSRAAVGNRLVNMIEANDDRLDTGFLSVPYLLDVLVALGHEDLAKRVFMQDRCPSWLYEVDAGGTTIWESWSGIHEDGTVGTLSFNHYAMGCVLDWFIRNVIGLNAVTPGFAEVVINPRVDVVDEFAVSYTTPHGDLTIERHEHHLTVTAPAEISVVVTVPGQDPVKVGDRVTISY